MVWTGGMVDSGGWASVEELFYLTRKRFGVGEIAVHAGKPNVCNVVDGFEFAHHELANYPGLNLTRFHCPQFCFHLLYESINLRARNGAFGGRERHARAELLWVKRFPSVIVLCYHEIHPLHPFIGSEPLMAAQTLSPAPGAHGVSFAFVDYLGVAVFAKRAKHVQTFLSLIITGQPPSKWLA